MPLRFAALLTVFTMACAPAPDLDLADPASHAALTTAPPPAGVPIGGPLGLGVSTMSPGQPFTLRATGAPAGTRVYFVYESPTGASPCFPALQGQCLGLSAFSTLGSAVAAADARLTLTLPPGVPAGFTARFQAAYISSAGPVLSNVTSQMVVPAVDTDLDTDTLHFPTDTPYDTSNRDTPYDTDTLMIETAILDTHIPYDTDTLYDTWDTAPPVDTDTRFDTATVDTDPPVDTDTPSDSWDTDTWLVVDTDPVDTGTIDTTPVDTGTIDTGTVDTDTIDTADTDPSDSYTLPIDTSGDTYGFNDTWDSADTDTANVVDTFVWTDSTPDSDNPLDSDTYVFVSVPAPKTYTEKCADDGVPIPPPWGAGAWKNEGQVKALFAGSTYTELWTWSGGGGSCAALPRYTTTAASPISLFGVICTSSTGDTCFWDNLDKTSGARLPVNAGYRVGDGQGADQLGEVCTECHRGDNMWVKLPTEPTKVLRPRKSAGWDAIHAPANWTNGQAATAPPRGPRCGGCHVTPVLTKDWCDIAKSMVRRGVMPRKGLKAGTALAAEWNLVKAACNALP